MLYTEVKINEKVYKARLSSHEQVLAEREIGKSLLNIFTAVSEDNMPTLETLLIIFQHSLVKYNHGITMDEVYDIYDEYIDDGNSYVDFFQLINTILIDSGVFRVSSAEEEEKN